MITGQTEVFDENGESLGFLPAEPTDQEVIRAERKIGDGLSIIEAFTVNVILFSYNRPRMLREAILSVLGQSFQKFYIWVVDDGSDFDVIELINEFEDARIIACVAPQISAAERIDEKSTRFQDNVNYVLSQIPREGNLITYLCDDDVFHPDWLMTMNYMLNKYPIFHSINSACYYFWDGQNPFKEGEKGFLSELKSPGEKDMLVWWQVGSFAHLSKCYYECNVKWTVGRKGAHSWDVEYVKNLWNAHPSYIQMDVPTVYRREHSRALSHILGRFADGSYKCDPRPMEEEDVAGLME